MPLALVSHVELLGICAIDPVHGLAEIRPRSLNQEVVVIAHQTVGMADKTVSNACSLHEPEKPSSVLFGEVERSSQVPAAGDVIDAA